MDLTRYMTTLGSHLKARWGEHVHKVSLNGDFTCPNRDGSIGIGGCTFCNNSSFSPSEKMQISISEQLDAGRHVIQKRVRTRRYLAYFQAYTNTYADIDYLRNLYDQAMFDSDVIGMSVGTRPDCVPDKVLDLLLEYQNKGQEIWLELGLQSANDESLKRVNRGHGWAEYEDAVNRARSRGLQVCTHLIVGLPGEEASDSLVSLKKVLDLGTDGLKVHPLHVVKGTQLARAWKSGAYQPLTQKNYVNTVSDMVMLLPKSVVVHRLTATASDQLLLAPEWCSRKWAVLNAIAEELEIRQYQT